jgi:hypothetical protein
MKGFRKITLAICFLSYPLLVAAQANESPAGAYQWKRGKTEFQPGYVVLKAGKKMEGKISLKGSESQIAEVLYEGDGKELTFPVGSLKAYGLIGVNPNASAVAATQPINESPESMYEWQGRGIVMGKEIKVTVPRAGYIVLRNGTRYEGELKLRKKAGVLDDIDIKTATGKEKFDVPQVARYGYTYNVEEVAQGKLSKETKYKKSFQGNIYTASGKMAGEITLFSILGKRYKEKIIFKNGVGELKDCTPQTISGFDYVTSKGNRFVYTVIDGKFVEEQFNGKTFQLYMNPNPTSIKKFATALLKGAAQAGTQAAASAIIKKDQEKNNYDSNIDSIINVSSADQLIALREKFANLAGYENAQEAMNESGNESLKNNLSALDLAIQGKQAANSEGGILNEEWIIHNKISNENTVVYKGEYKNQIDVLLMGCDKYLELPKSAQNDLQKWDNLAQAVKLLDNCY